MLKDRKFQNYGSTMAHNKIIPLRVVMFSTGLLLTVQQKRVLIIHVDGLNCGKKL